MPTTRDIGPWYHLLSSTVVQNPLAHGTGETLRTGSKHVWYTIQQILSETRPKIPNLGDLTKTFTFTVVSSYKYPYVWLFQIDDYSMVKFFPLDITDDESIADILLQIDMAIQYGEDLEPKEIRVIFLHFFLLFFLTELNSKKGLCFIFWCNWKEVTKSSLE